MYQSHRLREFSAVHPFQRLGLVEQRRPRHREREGRPLRDCPNHIANTTQFAAHAGIRVRCWLDLLGKQAQKSWEQNTRNWWRKNLHWRRQNDGGVCIVVGATIVLPFETSQQFLHWIPNWLFRQSRPLNWISFLYKHQLIPSGYSSPDLGFQYDTNQVYPTSSQVQSSSLPPSQ